MKFTAKADANQPAVVKAIRDEGASVQHLHSVGAGCPDLLCSINGQAFLIEVKDGAKPPSAQKLTPAQVVWHASWQSPVHIVNSVDAAIKVVKSYRGD